MQVISGLDIVIYERLLAAVLVFKFQNLGVAAVFQNLPQQILDRIASVVDLRQFKYGYDTADLIPNRLVGIRYLYFHLFIRGPVNGQIDDELIIIQFFICHSRIV